MEENLVFRLEEGSSSTTHGAMHHLAISSNWKGDEHKFNNTVELSRIRSLTVFGKWRPFYISDNMRFLRVLDLEDSDGLADHHLRHIAKHLHLRYLSLRRCWGIRHLPDSVGNLRQLETLDIKGTRIRMLPKTITELSKLRYLHASFHCRVTVPRGIRKLETLHTLRYVHLARGNAVARRTKVLTGLRKLGVSGINMKNGLEFCSAISSLSHLESLSMLSHERLNGCLDVMSTTLENLQSLKLLGCLEKLPEWITELQNLVKLRLNFTSLSCNREAMQALGNLPNLSILGLCESDSKIDVLQFQSGLFRRLTVLDLYFGSMEIVSVEFEEGSMPNLEVLVLGLTNTETAFLGLELLERIKEVRLSVHLGWYSMKSSEDMSYAERGKEAENKRQLVEDKVREELRIQLGRNKNWPVLKVE